MQKLMTRDYDSSNKLIVINCLIVTSKKKYAIATTFCGGPSDSAVGLGGKVVGLVDDIFGMIKAVTFIFFMKY